jgi:hypothetical protein
MSEKKTFREWFEDFKKEIEKGYENTTMATVLSGYIYKDRDKVPTTLTKLDSPPRAFGLHEGESLSSITTNVTHRSVKPKEAGFILDLKGWSDNPDEYGMDMLMNELGKQLADREYAIIVDGLKSCAGYTVNARQKGQLSKDDIREAQSHTEHYGDSVIMNHQQEMEFWKNGEISEPIRIPESFVPKERRGYYYSGMIGAVNVYWASFIKDFALVFDRGEMMFASTRLEIEFDNMDNPKQLILHKTCVAAPMFDQAVVKIELV